MKHTPLTAARAARTIIEHTSRIAKTWPEYEQARAHSLSLPPAARPGDMTWANAYQAYRLAKEQLLGLGQNSTQECPELAEAVQEVFPELFADYWEKMLFAGSPDRNVEVRL